MTLHRSLFALGLVLPLALVSAPVFAGELVDLTTDQKLKSVLAKQVKHAQILKQKTNNTVWSADRQKRPQSDVTKQFVIRVLAGHGVMGRR